MQKTKILSTAFVISFLILTSACNKSEDRPPAEIGVLPKPGDPTPKASSCEDFLAKLPEDYLKGSVQVPEDYSKPEGLKIKIAYYGKLIPGQTPTVFYNGGPGGSSWSSYRALTKVKFKEWQNTSFIYIDQRGNGCSEAYPEFTGEVTDEMIQRYQHYGSTSIVKDSEVIRKKIWGNKPWKIFGQSYGAAIVHRYVIVAPEGVLSAHAHANTINSDPVERMTNRIGSQGRVVKEYLSRFPEDEAPLRVLGKNLTKTTCVQSEDGAKKVCGFELTEALVTSLGFSNNDNWFSIHQWVHYLVKNDRVNLERLREFADVTAFSSGEGTPGRNMAKSVLAFGDRRVITPDFLMNYQSCKEIFERLKQQGYQSPEEWPINECASTYQAGPGPDPAAEKAMGDRVVKLIAADHLTLEAFESALVAHPNIPFFLYSGEYDTFVPRESFQEEVQKLGSRIQYTHFMGTGHEGFYVEPLVWKNLRGE